MLQWMQCIKCEAAYRVGGRGGGDVKHIHGIRASKNKSKGASLFEMG